MRKRFGFVLALALIAVAGLAQTAGAFEPQDYSTFYYLSPSGQPAELERQNPSQSMQGGKLIFEMTGERSPVRFPAGTPMQFVVRVTEPFDKAKTTIQFFRQDPENGKRLLVVKQKDFAKNTAGIKVNVERYGSSSVKVVPAQPLSPGEYCLSRTTISQGFCFGIDPAK